MKHFPNAFMIKFVLLALAVLFLSATSLRAQEAKPQGLMKQETALQKQVRVVASKLRCPVCQGESVYDSHAEVAVEMKKLIAEKLAGGASEQDVLQYFQERYGNYILMEPPVDGIHWVIWAFPVFMTLVGLLFLYQFITGKDQETSNRTVEGDDVTRVKTSGQSIEEMEL